MTDPIALIISLTGCSEEDATIAYKNTNDPVDAVEQILNKIAPVPATAKISRKRKREDITADEEYINSLRPTMELMNTQIEASITSSRHAPSSGVVTQVPREETVLQNNCSQECQIPSAQEEAQTQETVSR